MSALSAVCVMAALTLSETSPSDAAARITFYPVE